MLRLQKLLKRSLREDRGLTLVELLVAITIFGILLTLVASLYSGALRTVGLSRELVGNTKNVSTAMNETSRVIRAATENPVGAQVLNDPAFVVAEPDDVVVYAYINLDSSAEKPVMIRLRVDKTTGNFVESRWPATPLADGKWQFTANPCETVNVPGGCTAPASIRIIASAISPYTSGDYTFTYLDSNGQAMANTSAGLALADRRLVAFVRVTLKTQFSLTDASNPVTLQNTVGIPNLGFAKDSQ